MQTNAIERINVDDQRRRSTLAITNAIKLVGLVIVLYEIFGKATPQPVGMAIAGFMMAGAQLSEDTLLHLVSRMFGAPESKEETPPKPKPKPRQSQGQRKTTTRDGGSGTQTRSRQTPRGRK